MGIGRLKLLKAIQETGSMNEAAKQLGMSYKKAWKLVKVMNNNYGEDLVTKLSGGKGGGGAFITHEGLKLVEKYEDTLNSIREQVGSIEEELKNKK